MRRVCTVRGLRIYPTKSQKSHANNVGSRRRGFIGICDGMGWSNFHVWGKRVRQFLQPATNVVSDTNFLTF